MNESLSSAEQHVSMLQDEAVLIRANAYAEHGVPLHLMSRDVTALLAQYGLYTTTEPREIARGPLEFHYQAAHERAFEQIATNVMTAAARSHRLFPLVAAGRLGSYMATVLNDEVTAVHGDDVYIRDPQITRGRITDGIVTAENMIFSVTTAEAADRLSDIFQFLLRSQWEVHTVRSESTGTRHAVTVENLNEHSIRSIERRIGILVAKEDFRLLGAKLPPKDRLEDWKRAGETFPPILDQRLMSLVQAYRQLEDSGSITATYRGYDLEPWRGKDILGTCPARSLQAARSIMNGLIRGVFPEGSARNQELPAKEYRYIDEQYVELRRKPIDPHRNSPPPSRLPTVTENLEAASRRMVERTRSNPIIVPLTAAAKLAGLGIATVAEIGVAMVPRAGNTLRGFADDYALLMEQEQALAASNARVRSLVRFLIAEHVSRYPESPYDGRYMIVPVII